MFSFLVFTPGSSRVRSSISANLQKRTNVLFTVTMDNSQFSLSCKIWRFALPNVLKTLAGSTLEDTKRDDWSFFFFFLYFEDHSAVWRGCFELAVQASRSISSSWRFTRKTASKRRTCWGKATILRTVHQFAHRSSSRGRLGTAGASWLRAERLSTGNGQENDTFGLRGLWSNLTPSVFFCLFFHVAS